jgi:hypothetical protein
LCTGCRLSKPYIVAAKEFAWCQSSGNGCGKPGRCSAMGLGRKALSSFTQRDSRRTGAVRFLFLLCSYILMCGTKCALSCSDPHNNCIQISANIRAQFNIVQTSAGAGEAPSRCACSYGCWTSECRAYCTASRPIRMVR